ncbi:MAG: CGNR zinc finger domain-containing protein [Nitriliruptorales bacterium]|nr:CGNR zinc finger domain-containing protein [Nitriliruptorales bacterium]
MAEQEAPGRLETLRLFLNTLDVEKGHDELGDWGEVVSWLLGAGLMSKGADGGGPEGLATVRHVRESFRDLLHAEAHGGDDPEARATLNDIAEQAQLRPKIAGPGEAGFAVGRGGVIGALGQLMAIAIEAMSDGTWERLKVCDNDGCAWAFYDHSRNRSGRWCSMEVCGNRMKVKAYRERAASE